MTSFFGLMTSPAFGCVDWAVRAVQQRAGQRAPGLVPPRLAGRFFAAGSIHLEFIVDRWRTGATEGARTHAPQRGAADNYKRLSRDGQPVRAHLARFSLTPAGSAGALEKGGYRVRGFGGLFVFPVMARVHTWTWALPRVI